MPEESSFPIPLMSFDVVRRTNTTWDVLQKRQTDDCWNVHGDRQLPRPWSGFTQFTFLNTAPPPGIHVVRREIDKDPSNVQARVHMARSLVEDVEDISAKRKTALGRRKSRSSTVHESCEEFVISIWKRWNSMKP